MDATQTIQDALDASPDMRLVLDAANRARAVEQLEPLKNFWINTEVVSSEYPVSQATESLTQKT
jgi:chemotaxis response regulator CheB